MSYARELRIKKNTSQKMMVKMVAKKKLYHQLLISFWLFVILGADFLRISYIHRHFCYFPLKMKHLIHGVCMCIWGWAMDGKVIIKRFEWPTSMISGGSYKKLKFNLLWQDMLTFMLYLLFIKNLPLENWNNCSTSSTYRFFGSRFSVFLL